MNCPLKEAFLAAVPVVCGEILLFVGRGGRNAKPFVWTSVVGNV